MTVQAFVDPEEVEELIESWKDKPNTSSEKEDENKTVEVSGSFPDAMKLYDERANTVEASWKDKQYDDALEKGNRIQVWLNNHRPDPANRFQSNVYECYRTRSLLQQDLIRVDKLASQNNRIRARANMRLAKRRANVLRNHSAELMTLKPLSEKQEKIRALCVRHTRALIELAMKKARMYKI